MDEFERPHYLGLKFSVENECKVALIRRVLCGGKFT
jgi:hypothetical protein